MTIRRKVILLYGEGARTSAIGCDRPHSQKRTIQQTQTCQIKLRRRYLPDDARNLIAGQGLPFETLCIESRLTAVVVVTGGLAVGHGVFERDASDLERLQECRRRVADHLVGISAA